VDGRIPTTKLIFLYLNPKINCMIYFKKSMLFYNKGIKHVLTFTKYQVKFQGFLFLKASVMCTMLLMIDACNTKKQDLQPTNNTANSNSSFSKDAKNSNLAVRVRKFIWLVSLDKKAISMLLLFIPVILI